MIGFPPGAGGSMSLESVDEALGLLSRGRQGQSSGGYRYGGDDNRYVEAVGHIGAWWVGGWGMGCSSQARPLRDEPSSNQEPN